MPDPEGRIQRLLSLIPYVLKHQGVSLDELCEVFEVSQGQLLGDLNLIFMCGQPDYTPADLIDVTIDDDRVHINMADYFSRPLRFTPAELSGLYLACSAMVRLSGQPSSSALTSAMEKIATALGLGPVSRDDIEQSVKFHPLTPEHEVIAELSRASDERRVVKMEYYTYGRDDLTTRRVHPLSLEFGMGHWYLRAWDDRSREVRLFRVDRIKDLSVTGDVFEPHPGEEEESLPGTHGVTVEGEIEVRLRFSRELARWAKEQTIFSETREQKGGLVCTLHTDNLSWLERELLRYGTEVEVLSPPELKERLRDRVRGILSMYE
jgi:predicted DNA-binding transcriptional regulator YafY